MQQKQEEDEQMVGISYSHTQRKTASEPETPVQQSALAFSSTTVCHIGPSWARFGHLGGLKWFSRFVTQDLW